MRKRTLLEEILKLNEEATDEDYEEDDDSKNKKKKESYLRKLLKYGALGTAAVGIPAAAYLGYKKFVYPKLYPEPTFKLRDELNKDNTDVNYNTTDTNVDYNKVNTDTDYNTTDTNIFSKVFNNVKSAVSTLNTAGELTEKFEKKYEDFLRNNGAALYNIQAQDPTIFNPMNNLTIDERIKRIKKLAKYDPTLYGIKDYSKLRDFFVDSINMGNDLYSLYKQNFMKK